MGIPNLYSLLRPYAQPEKFPSQSAEELTDLYIDGPALAYHVYHTSLNENYYDSLGRVRRNPFDAVVEYDDFVREVGKFVQRLEMVGFRIKKIYFDGYLPPVKLSTRLARLTTSLSQLLAYHSLHPKHIPSFASSHRHASSSQKAPRLSKPQSLPSPPFIVSTALSFLLGGKWSGLVETVPGEADAWCASAAVREGGWVMSGDTDLLLYGHSEESLADTQEVQKSKQNWGVIMFRDFSFVEEKNMGERENLIAKAMVFRPRLLNKLLFGGDDLATALSLPLSPLKPKQGGKKKPGKQKKGTSGPSASVVMDQFNQPKPPIVDKSPSLLSLAYHLQNEPAASMTRLKQLVKASSSIPDMSQRERAFRMEYTLVSPPSIQSPKTEKQERESDVDWQLRHLDPRVSELVYQLPVLATKVHPPRFHMSSTKQSLKHGKIEKIEIDSFLPFLYEDPTRSGAWDVGRDIRGVVYGILAEYQNKISAEHEGEGKGVKLIVKEHVRRGKRIKDVLVEVGEVNRLTEQDKQQKILKPELKAYIDSWKRQKRNTPVTTSGMKRVRNCECSNYWWVQLVVEMVVRDYAEKGKEMPISSEVDVIVHMLSQAAKSEGEGSGEDVRPVEKKQREVLPQCQEPDSPPKWTWSMIHLFGQVQAGVYSLWMLKQLMVFALALGDTLSTEERQSIFDFTALLDKVPPVEKVIAGKKFLDGLSRRQEGVDRRHCEVCGFGEESIMEEVVQKWRMWEAQTVAMDEENGVRDIDADEREGGEEITGTKVTWGGMEVDF